MIPLDEPRLRSLLDGHELVGRYLQVLPSTDSTNERCHERASDRGAEGLVIVAEHQTSGRGQRGRVWSAPPGSSLLFSVLLFPEERLANAGFLTAWAASAVCEELRRDGLEAAIKWPNDVLVRGRKICGILVERRQATVVGIGLNVSIQPHEFPDELRLPATSLETERKEAVDRTEYLARILRRLDVSFAESQREGPEPLYQRWRALAEPLEGASVRLTTTTGYEHGRLIECNPGAGAWLTLPDGSTRHVSPEVILRVERTGRACS